MTGRTNALIGGTDLQVGFMSRSCVNCHEVSPKTVVSPVPRDDANASFCVFCLGGTNLIFAAP